MHPRAYWFYDSVGVFHYGAGLWIFIDGRGRILRYVRAQRIDYTGFKAPEFDT